MCLRGNLYWIKTRDVSDEFQAHGVVSESNIVLCVDKKPRQSKTNFIFKWKIISSLHL